MLALMCRYLFVFLCFIAVSAEAAGDDWTLLAEQWARPRSGASLVRMAPLPELVERLGDSGERQLTIAYPGGEEGSLWAHELRSWLVALGVPSRRIQLVSGGQQSGALDLRLRDLRLQD